MVLEIGFPDNLRSMLKSMREAAEQHAAFLRRKLEATEQVRKTLQQLSVLMSVGRPFHILYLMEQHGALRSSFPRFSSEQLTALDEITGIATAQAQEVLRRYPALLDLACQKAGLPLDRTSRHPEYNFEKGFFRLKVDKRGMATLSNAERNLGKFPADIDNVINRVREEHTRVFGRPFDGDAFLKELSGIYSRILHSKGLEEGSSVAVRELHRLMSREKRGYRIDEFVIDVSRLVRQGPLEIDGKRLELRQTESAKKGIRLYDVKTAGLVGLVRFKEVTR